jgi:hypothetical protein
MFKYMANLYGYWTHMVTKLRIVRDNTKGPTHEISEVLRDAVIRALDPDTISNPIKKQDTGRRPATIHERMLMDEDYLLNRELDNLNRV